MEILDKKTLKLTELCRLCLTEDGLMVHLFAEESYGRKLPLPERIQCCTTVEIKKGDGLPVVICHRCLYYVDSLFDFQARCQRVDIALHLFCHEIKAQASKIKQKEVSLDRNHHTESTEPALQRALILPEPVDTNPEVVSCNGALKPTECFEERKVNESGDSSNSLEQVVTDRGHLTSSEQPEEKLINGSSESELKVENLIESDMSAKDSRMSPSNKPYHCPHCNKPFTYKARLAAHIKTHGESQVYQGDATVQLQQQSMSQSVPPQSSQHSMHHSMPQQPVPQQTIHSQPMQAQQPHLQHQLSPGANPYSSQHGVPYVLSSQHMQQQGSIPQSYMTQQSMPHGSPRSSSQPITPMHSMPPQHHPMQQMHHLQQQQQASMHQVSMQQQTPLQQQVSMQQQMNLQSQQQSSALQQVPMQQHGTTQHQSSMQLSPDVVQQPIHQQQQSLPTQQQSMQQQIMQQHQSLQQPHQSMQQQHQGMQQQQHQVIQQQQQQQQHHGLQQRQQLQGLQQQHAGMQQQHQGMQQQHQSLQQQSVGQTYDGRMYDMNYMPETPGTPPSSGNESSYSCSSCSASFMTPWMLADHVRSRCCDPNVSYNCEKCYSQFGSFNDLEQHKLSRSCENQVPSYYDAYTPPPSHYGMYSHQQHQQDYSSGGEMIDSRSTPSPWNVVAARSPSSVVNSGSSRSRIQRQDSYSTRSPQLGTMEELEKFAMSNTVVTSPLEPLASPGLTEPLASAPSPLDPENSVQSVQSVQSTQSTQSSGSGSCGTRSAVNFNTTSGARFGGPNFCGGNVNTNANYGTASTNSPFLTGTSPNFGNLSQNFSNSSSNQGFGGNTMVQNPLFGNNSNCLSEQVLNSKTSSNTQNMNFVEESNLSFGNSLSSNYSKKSGSDCSSPQDARLMEVNANTKFCDDMNSHLEDLKGSPLADRNASPRLGSTEHESRSHIGMNESLNVNINDAVSGSCLDMLLTTSPGSSKGCMGGGGDNPYSCQVCKASFASRTLFSNHMKTHAPDRSVKCNLCNNSFPTTAALRSHVDSVHSESGSEKSLHIVLDDSRSPGKMDEFGHSEDSDDEPLSKLVKPTPPVPKRRGRKPKNSVEAVESENGEKSHECIYCGKGFISAARLAIHTKLHTTEKPFKCDQCDKAFRSRAHLQRHVKTHAGDKPFKCETCNKSFTVSMNLKIHMRTHTGERPYQCNLCKMAFIGYSHLYNHLKTHSDTQGPFTYTYFNKVYTTTGNFTLTKREKTARGRNKDRDIENEPSKEGDEHEQVKAVVKTLSKSTSGKKRGRKAHFYEPEPDDDEDDDIDGVNDEEEGNEMSDETFDFK